MASPEAWRYIQKVSLFSSRRGAGCVFAICEHHDDSNGTHASLTTYACALFLQYFVAAEVANSHGVMQITECNEEFRLRKAKAVQVHDEYVV
jgi:hypothetical protein